MVRAPAGSGSLKVSRTFDSPRERIFEAWTNPDLLRQWWAPPGFKMGRAAIDLKEGGCFRIAMTAPDGSGVFAVGMLKTVRRPELLEFLWEWQGWDPGGEEAVAATRVAVEFHQRKTATEVLLTQTGFPSEEIASRHKLAWRECLDRIDQLI